MESPTLNSPSHPNSNKILRTQIHDITIELNIKINEQKKRLKELEEHLKVQEKHIKELEENISVNDNNLAHISEGKLEKVTGNYKLTKPFKDLKRLIEKQQLLPLESRKLSIKNLKDSIQNQIPELINLDTAEIDETRVKMIKTQARIEESRDMIEELQKQLIVRIESRIFEDYSQNNIFGGRNSVRKRKTRKKRKKRKKRKTRKTRKAYLY